ncbi:MAG: arginase family protein [Motilibacteraceae bacterium]
MPVSNQPSTPGDPSSASLPVDPRWPRAGHWLAARLGSRPVDGPAGRPADLALLGVPASRTSISPTGAHATPTAVRQALLRLGTWSWRHRLDLADVAALDLGDVPDPDADEAATEAAAADGVARARLLLALGGDNSITCAVARGAAGPQLPTAGLVTLDAHHDLRDGRSNGSPVRRLVEAGLSGTRVVQVGIADWANSPEYAARARDLGITVVPLHEAERRPMADVMAEALDVAGAGGGPVHVDLDVDVCDRSVAPACPAALPGGLSARALLDAAHAAARDPRVRSLDLTEVDATADVPDGRTVRLVALAVLEAAAGVALRPAGA